MDFEYRRSTRCGCGAESVPPPAPGFHPERRLSCPDRRRYDEASFRSRPDTSGAPPRVVATLLGSKPAWLTAGASAHGARPLWRASRLRRLFCLLSLPMSSIPHSFYDCLAFVGTTLTSSIATKQQGNWSAKLSPLEQRDTGFELPEYDLRRAATARDPLAVVEGYRVEIYLRLAAVLGVRMCPLCPRCNAYGNGCQDRLGSNMRPTGGCIGGMTALGGSTAYQGSGTPHLHAEGHVVCAYQFDTMQEI